VAPVAAVNILRHELIGLEATARGALTGTRIKGIIIDETRNTLILDHAGREKRVAKGGEFFVFNLGGALVEVEGAALIGRPEDRVKKKSKRDW
jgi:ribonuclease P protein subunit POP4